MSKRGVRRGLRGGSLGRDSECLRTTFRRWGKPEDRYGVGGFRIVVVRGKQ